MAVKTMDDIATPDPLRQPKRISLADSVADSIAEAISTRHILPGERIVESSLTSRLGVSRVPIREALRVLHAQGILSGGGFKGYRVTDFGPEVTQQILEVRLSLETILLRDAIANWRSGAADISELDRAIEDMRRSARAGDVRASLLADLQFHRTIREAAGNAIVGTLWDAIARHVLIIFNFDRFRDDDLDAIPTQHEELRDRILDIVAHPVTEADLQALLEDHMLQIARTKRKHLR
ncbi:MAG: GntR family transcriptional regulator [Rhodobacteraceae bacterium]|nr:GntR family transcriptional regulator [Paracoccaceae bacterium]